MRTRKKPSSVINVLRNAFDFVQALQLSPKLNRDKLLIFSQRLYAFELIHPIDHEHSTDNKLQGLSAWSKHALFAAVLLVVCLVLTLRLQAQSFEFGPPFIISEDFAAPAGLGIDVTNGRVLIADTGNHRVNYAATDDFEGTGTLNWNDFGFVPGLLQPEAINGPQGVAVDTAGNAYVVDTFGGEVQLFRWNSGLGTYTDDPSFAQSTRNTVDGVDISFPRDIAVGSDGKVYLLDSGNRRILVADGSEDDSWEVWRENPAWGNPYGLDVADDARVYIADTDNHQILRMLETGQEEAIGSFGTGNGQFRYPRDVAVSSDGRIFVADTFNYRVAIVNSDGSHYLNLGAAPLFGTLQKIEVDADNRVFVIDSGYNRLVAYLGMVNQSPFDAYARDYSDDTGIEPSDLTLLISPDILIRNNADVDLQQAAVSGLGTFAVQWPGPGINNHIYLAVRNRGNHGMAGVTVQLYWVAPYDQSEFLPDWRTDGFYRSYTSEDVNEPGNEVFIPFIGPRHTSGNGEVDGVEILGPFIWRIPEPNYPDNFDGRFFLIVRIFHPNDSADPIPTDALYIDDKLDATSALLLHDLDPASINQAREMESQLQALDVTVIDNIAFFSGGILDMGSLVTLINSTNPDVVYFATQDTSAESTLGKELLKSDYEGIYFHALNKFLAISYLEEYTRRNNNVALWRSDIIVDPVFPTGQTRPFAPDTGGISR